MNSNPYCPSKLNRDAELRLVCLPYAGGGSAMYHRWRSALPRRIDLLPISLPGREERMDERPYTDLRTLVREIASAIEPCIDRQFALLGHSMGAWIAFELARELRRRAWRAPRALIAAASPPPHAPHSQRPLHLLTDAEFVMELGRRFDGVPPAVQENEELLRLLLPALRADIQMVESYQYDEQPPLGTDILAIGGADDPAVSPTELAEWRRHTAGRFSARRVPGGHFFLFHSEQAAVRAAASTPALRMIVESLERYLEN